MTNDNQKHTSGSVKDLLAVGASTILSLFPATVPIGGMGSYGLFVWQREQLISLLMNVNRDLISLTKISLTEHH
jgi:hypothetical protein